MTKPWATDAERAVLTYFLPENIVITNHSVQLTANSLFRCSFKVGFLHSSFYVERYRSNWSIWYKTVITGKDGKGAFLRTQIFSHCFRLPWPCFVSKVLSSYILTLLWILLNIRFNLFTKHDRQFVTYRTWKSTLWPFFIVAPCILKFTQFTQQQMHYLLTWLKVLNLH